MRDITLLAARAARAFHEMYPMRESIVEPGRVYRTLNYGPHLDVFMLDERSYRGANGPNLQTTYGPDSYFIGPDQLAWLKRALLNSRATWKVIASDMPLSLIVYDDATNKKGSEAFAQGDGPPRGRELEIADILRFIKTSGVTNTVWLTADVHYAAAHYYNPDKAQFQDFEPFWEFVSGPFHAGTFGPNELDNTFGPEVKFVKAPGAGQAEPAAVGRHAVLRSCQDRGRDRPDDGDVARPRRRGAVVDDARSEAGVAPQITDSRRTSASQPATPSLGPAFQHALAARRSKGLRQPRPVRERRRKLDIGAIAGDEDKGNLQRLQPLGDRKTLFADQPDIEQGKIRRAIGDHLEAPSPRFPRSAPSSRRSPESCPRNRAR